MALGKIMAIFMRVERRSGLITVTRIEWSGSQLKKDPFTGSCGERLKETIGLRIPGERNKVIDTGDASDRKRKRTRQIPVGASGLRIDQLQAIEGSATKELIGACCPSTTMEKTGRAGVAGGVDPTGQPRAT